MERVPRPVDDRLEQFVPGPGRRGQPGDVVDEAQLVELVAASCSRRARADPVSLEAVARRLPVTRTEAPSVDRRHVHHDTRVGKVAVAERLRRGPRWVAARPTRGRRRGERLAAPSAAGRRPTRRAGRHRVGRRPRPARARGPAPRRAARPGHHRAGRRSRLRRSSSDRGVPRSPCARTTTRREREPARGRARRPRSRRRRGGHRGLLAVLPARQPGRGARPGPGAPPARACGPRRAARRLGRRGGRPAAAGRAQRRGARRDPRPAAHHARCSRRIRPRRAGGRRSSPCAAARVLLERLDDPRLTPSEDREIRRRLREEITLLWRTADLRVGRARAARRGPDGDGGVRRHAVHGRPAAVPERSIAAHRAAGGTAAGPGPTAAGAGVPALRVVDRRRPRRQPVGDGRAHGAHAADPGRPRPAWLRGGRGPADADRLGGHPARPCRRAAR